MRQILIVNSYKKVGFLSCLQYRNSKQNFQRYLLMWFKTIHEHQRIYMAFDVPETDPCTVFASSVQTCCILLSISALSFTIILKPQTTISYTVMISLCYLNLINVKTIYPDQNVPFCLNIAWGQWYVRLQSRIPSGRKL